MAMSRRLAVAVILVLLVLVSACAGAVEYNRRYLDAPGYPYGLAVDINDSGQVVGKTDYNQAFFWDTDGTPTAILLPQGANEALPSGININGQVTGTAYGTGDFYWGRGFAWSQETGYVPLEMPSGATRCEGVSINDAGQIVGRYGGPTLDSGLSGVWDAATGDLLATASASYYDINNQGQKAGWWFGPGEQLAASWDTDGSLHKYYPINGLEYSQGDRINNAGQVAGLSFTGSNYAVTLWNPDGSGIEIPGLGGISFVEDLNNDGQVLFLSAGSSGPLYSYLWTPGLGAAAFTDGSLFGLNDQGQVVGVADGLPCVWTPVPEPASIVTLLAGLAGVVSLRLRRRG